MPEQPVKAGFGKPGDFAHEGRVAREESLPAILNPEP